MIYDSTAGDILNQLITFSRVFDEQRRIYPDDMRKAVQETIRICKEKDVLAAYLEREEAATVMFTFADQEKEYNRALRAERREGEARGEAKGDYNRMIEAAKGMYAEGIKPEVIARVLKVSVDVIENIIGLQPV